MFLVVGFILPFKVFRAHFVARYDIVHITCSFIPPVSKGIEKSVINFMCQTVGYPRGADGYVTSCGSTGTVIAMATARDSKRLRQRTTISKFFLAHNCMAKRCINSW